MVEDSSRGWFFQSLNSLYIIAIVVDQEKLSISAIKAHLQEQISTATLNRDLAALVAKNCVIKIGKGRATVYQIAPGYKLFAPLEMSGYFDS